MSSLGKNHVLLLSESPGPEVARGSGSGVFAPEWMLRWHGWDTQFCFSGGFRTLDALLLTMSPLAVWGLGSASEQTTKQAAPLSQAHRGLEPTDGTKAPRPPSSG